MLLATILAFSIAALVETASAQPLDENWTRCVNLNATHSPDEAVAGCTAIIQDGKVSKYNLETAYFNRARHHWMKHDSVRAIADLDMAIQLNPQDAAAHVMRGNAYAEIQDLARAIIEYDEAIRINPRYAMAYNNRGLVLIMVGKQAEGEADIARARSIDPNVGN